MNEIKVGQCWKIRDRVYKVIKIENGKVYDQLIQGGCSQELGKVYETNGNYLVGRCNLINGYGTELYKAINEG